MILISSTVNFYRAMLSIHPSIHPVMPR